MSVLRDDLRYAARRLRRSPAYTFTAGLTLALGIGGNVAIFGVAYAALFQPLPFAGEDTLFRLQMSAALSGGSGGQLTGVPPHAFSRLREELGSFQQLAAQRFREVTLGGAEPDQASAIEVGQGWLPTLGVVPMMGRGFTAGEERAGAASGVTLISHRFWQTRLGGRSDVLGAPVSIDGVSHRVIGVMPREFNYPYGGELWLPAVFDATLGQPGNLNVVARLRPEATPAEARAELETLARRLAAEAPGAYAGRGLVAVPIRRVLVEDQGRVVIALLAAVGLVLLVACANVATLTLARSQSRRQELALRSALGASRWRQVRHLLTEGMVLAAVAGAAGLLFAVVAADSLTALIPGGMADLRPHVRVGPAVMGFGAAISLLAGLIFGLVPALRAARLEGSLVAPGARATGGLGHGRLLRGLVALEVGLVLALLAGIGMMLQDFQRLLLADLGVDAERVVTLELALPRNQYGTPAERVRLIGRLQERASTVPGVEAAAVTSNLPVVSHNMLATVTAEHAVERPGESAVANHRLVTPGYFRTMGIQLKRGRDIAPSDVSGAPGVAVVSEAMARRHWGDDNPLGRKLKQGRQEQPGEWLTVVGVVEDVAESNQAIPSWYLPYAQGAHPSAVAPVPPSRIILTARTAGSISGAARALRAAIREVAPTLPVFDVATMADHYAERLAPRRLGSILGAGFGILALMIGAVGIYGVVADGVAQRQREFGVRLALGAEPRTLALAVLRRESAAIALGGAVGIAGALLLTGLMAGSVVAATAPDYELLLGAAALLGTVATMAAYLPVRRATRVDPALVLRSE